MNIASYKEDDKSCDYFIRHNDEWKYIGRHEDFHKALFYFAENFGKT